jgi:hypothetical protein
VAIAIGVVLARSPVTVAGNNSVAAEHGAGYVYGGTTNCQVAGTVPRGTSAIRFSFSNNVGPAVTVKVLSGGRVVTQGTRHAGWGVDETVTVPVKRISHAIPDARVCVAFGPTVEAVEINGSVARATTPSGSAVRFRMEYLRPGDSSWWSLASTVARRMGLGHAPSGTWIVFLLIALMITVATLVSRLLLRELG